MATLGEIANSHGFKGPKEMYEAFEKKRREFKTFSVGQTVTLPSDYKPTHFQDEKQLPTDTPLVISVVGDVDIFCNYHIQIEGFDEEETWFDAKLFKEV